MLDNQRPGKGRGQAPLLGSFNWFASSFLNHRGHRGSQRHRCGKLQLVCALSRLSNLLILVFCVTGFLIDPIYYLAILLVG